MITGKILGNRYVVNGLPADIAGYVPDMSADTYYEVVRLIDGEILFLPDHLERLRKSVSGSTMEFPGDQMIINSIKLLINENPFTAGNIRICLQKTGGSMPSLQCYYIPYVYPDPSMYLNGVKLAIYHHQRPNPGIKKWDDQFRRSVAKFILEQDVYEAVLINPENQITEGSRSNIFFIDQEGGMITVPEKEILPGITRKYVLEIAGKYDIRVLERIVSMDELDSMKSAFISGTSPKVLPVKQIDKYYFDVNLPLLHLLKNEFELVVKAHLTKL
jgi:branched-chain amino acid aminotransferase